LVQLINLSFLLLEHVIALGPPIFVDSEFISFCKLVKDTRGDRSDRKTRKKK